MTRTLKYRPFRRFGLDLLQLDLNKPRIPVLRNGVRGFCMGLQAQTCRTAIKVAFAPWAPHIGVTGRSRWPSRRSNWQADMVPETRTGLNPVVCRE